MMAMQPRYDWYATDHVLHSELDYGSEDTLETAMRAAEKAAEGVYKSDLVVEEWVPLRDSDEGSWRAGRIWTKQMDEHGNGEWVQGDA